MLKISDDDVAALRREGIEVTWQSDDPLDVVRLAPPDSPYLAIIANPKHPPQVLNYDGTVQPLMREV